MRYPGFVSTFGSRLGAGLADELLGRWFPAPPTLLEKVAAGLLDAIKDVLASEATTAALHSFFSRESDASAKTTAQTTIPLRPDDFPPVKRLGEFTCPKCGGHTWSWTGVNGHDDNGTRIRMCTGYLPTKSDIPLPCIFTWKATDDHLYFSSVYVGPAAVSTAPRPNEWARTEEERKLDAIADSLLNRDWPSLELAVGKRKNDGEHLMGAAARLLTEADAFIARQAKQIEGLIFDNEFKIGCGEVSVNLSHSAAKRIGVRYAAEGVATLPVVLVLNDWKWSVRVGATMISIDWNVAEELLREAKTAYLCSPEAAQNAAGGVA